MTQEHSGFYKLEAPKGMEFMKGTNGHMDYLLLGVFDGFRIGFKPMYHHTKDNKQHSLGFRVRVEWASKDATVLDLKQSVKIRFPQTPFSKLSDKHCSMVGGIPMTDVYDTDSIYLWMDNINYIGSTVQAIENLMSIDLSDRKEEIMEFLDKAYRLIVSVVNSDKETLDPVPSVENNVVLFEPKDKDDG